MRVPTAHPFHPPACGRVGRGSGRGGPFLRRIAEVLRKMLCPLLASGSTLPGGEYHRKLNLVMRFHDRFSEINAPTCLVGDLVHRSEDHRRHQNDSKYYVSISSSASITPNRLLAITGSRIRKLVIICQSPCNCGQLDQTE